MVGPKTNSVKLCLKLNPLRTAFAVCTAAGLFLAGCMNVDAPVKNADPSQNELATALATTASYQAENAAMQGAVSVLGSTTYTGWTGTGYADYINSSGDYVDFSVAIATTGDYDLKFRY